jgi:hypothetical protein
MYIYSVSSALPHPSDTPQVYRFFYVVSQIRTVKIRTDPQDIIICVIKCVTNAAYFE